MKTKFIFTLMILGLIMGIFSLFKSKNGAVTQTPWRDYPSIYSHIKDNLDSKGVLKEEGDKLPDDERLFKDEEIKWVAGGLDGAFGHHGGGNNNEKSAKKIAKLINSISRKNTLSDKIELYDLLMQDSLLDYIDLALEQILEIEPPIEPYLLGYAKWLVTEGPDRGPVKFGIAILGLMNEKSNLDIITLLGKHEEFTLYSAVAVTNMLEKPEDVLWKMARSVNGWGRIQLVERLSNTDNPEIKNWLVSEGYKNSVMYEYLAYTCAVTGELHHILSKPVISVEMLDSAGDIIDALIAGGPAENIDDYEHAAMVISNYLKHLEHNAKTLEHFIVANNIMRFLSGSEGDWKNRTKGGWEIHDRHILSKKAEHIINNPKWEKLVLSHLNTADDVYFWQIKQSAEILNIDIWDTHWRRLTESPLDSGKWYNIMATVNANRIDNVLDFANNALPLSEIATGPDNKSGMGEKYNAHSCLDYILQELDRFPGKGVDLIKVGLRSPVVRNRNMSLKALSKWGQKEWPDGIDTFLEEVMVTEPDDELKTSMKKLLKGETLD